MRCTFIGAPGHPDTTEPVELEPRYCELTECLVRADRVYLHHVDRDGRIREAARDADGRRVVLPAEWPHRDFHDYMRDWLSHLRGRFALVTRGARGRFDVRRDLFLYETEAEYHALRRAPRPTPQEALRDADRMRFETAEQDAQQARAAEAAALARIIELEAELAAVREASAARERAEAEARERAEAEAGKAAKARERAERRAEAREAQEARRREPSRKPMTLREMTAWATIGCYLLAHARDMFRPRRKPRRGESDDLGGAEPHHEPKPQSRSETDDDLDAFLAAWRAAGDGEGDADACVGDQGATDEVGEDDDLDDLLYGWGASNDMGGVDGSGAWP